MSVMQVLDEEPVVIIDEEKALVPFHLVHRECHYTDSPPAFVTGLCGMVMDWDEKNDFDPDINFNCPGCAEATRCPVCHQVRWIRMLS